MHPCCFVVCMNAMLFLMEDIFVVGIVSIILAMFTYNFRLCDLDI